MYKALDKIFKKWLSAIGIDPALAPKIYDAGFTSTISIAKMDSLSPLVDRGLTVGQAALIQKEARDGKMLHVAFFLHTHTQGYST